MLIVFQYYKPWDLRPEEEGHIKSQIEKIRTAIEEELAEHADGRRIGDGTDEVHVADTGPPPNIDGAAPADSGDLTRAEMEQAELVSADSTAQPIDAPMPEDGDDHDAATTTFEDVPMPSAESTEERQNDDHGGEELVEGQEDDVIY